MKRFLSLVLILSLLVSLCLALPVSASSADAGKTIKADVVFVIDSTGSMSDEIYNVVQNINGFTEYLESLGVSLRISVIEYKDITVSGEEESTKVYELRHSPWHYTAEEVADTLTSIYVTGGGDLDETLVDALGCLLSPKTMLFRSDAHKFAIALTDAGYKNDNNFGYSGMDEVIDALAARNIYTSLIAPLSYQDYYSALYEETGGIFADIYGDFEQTLKDFADSIFGISSGKKAIYILPGYMGSRLYNASGEEIWVDESKLIDDITKYTVPFGDSTIFMRNADGTGGSYQVDRSQDKYGATDNYKKLVEALTDGCGDRYDVVFFSYDWLGDLSESAAELKKDIDRKGYDKVVFVTHSTGGLLASNFIARSAENRRLVEKAILIAPPLYGTYSSLQPIEYGEVFNEENPDGFIHKFVYQDIDSDSSLWDKGAAKVKYEAAKKWVRDVTRNSPTTYQLLPSVEYLKLAAALFIEDKATAVTTSSEYYDILNGSSRINPKLTNGNSRSHAYFRDTVLDGDIVSALQEVDTYLIGCSSGFETAAVAVYEPKLLGGSKLREFQYNKEGDGTVMGISAFALDKNGKHTLAYRDFENVSHGGLVEDAEVIDYVISLINGTESGTSGDSGTGKTGDGMRSRMKLWITSDKSLDISVYDVSDDTCASYSLDSVFGWDSGLFTFDVISEEDGEFTAQLYLPISGYRVVFSYGSMADVDVTAALEVSTLDYYGNKTAIATSTATATAEDGILFVMDATGAAVVPENIGTIVNNTPVPVTRYDTDWTIPASISFAAVGETAKLIPSGAEISSSELTWVSSDESVVKVDADGTVHAVGHGVAEITAVQDGSLKTMTCVATVKRNAVTVSFEDLEMLVGDLTKIRPVFDSDKVTETAVTYTVSEDGIISIDEDGVITAMSEGSVTVTGTAPGGASSTFTVSVAESAGVPVRSVSLSETSVSMEEGESVMLYASVDPVGADNPEVRWYVDDLTVASISADGAECKVTGIAGGKTTVTVVTEDGGFTASCTVSVGAGDSYAVTVVNGRADRAKASEGETVTIKAQASDEGQVFYRWTSSDGVTFADARSSETTFTMPDHPVTVTATYKAKSGGSSGSGSGGGQKDTGTYKITVEEAKNGTVTASKKTADKGDKVKLTVTPDEGWVLETLTVTTAKGKEVELTAGSGDTWSFKMPGADVTVRAAFERLNPYVDVEKGAYYYDAVLWAHYAQPQITNGMDATHFGPDTTTTRAHIVTFLWRANGCQEPAGVENPFEDVAESDYFYKAVLWAVEQGIVKGTDETHFTPAQTCSTAHIVTMLYRALGAGEDGWFEEAGAWAVAQGLLEDMELTVGTDVDCPRGAIVTFLYRALTGN